jgi:hypothetical protein
MQMTQQLIVMPIEHCPPAPLLIPGGCLDPRPLLQNIFVSTAKAPEFSQLIVF